MIDLDSLPPICLESASSANEINIAKQVFEYAVLLAVNSGDKDAFNRHMSCLRPYYSSSKYFFSTKYCCDLSLMPFFQSTTRIRHYGQYFGFKFVVLAGRK